jgi:hypothetical protein
VRLERLAKLKKNQLPHWNSNPRFPAFIIVPQPSALPLAPKFINVFRKALKRNEDFNFRIKGEIICSTVLVVILCASVLVKCTVEVF